MKTTAFGLIALLLCIAAGSLRATSVVRQNIGELTSLAELILVGRVERVTDGLNGSVPYTEVTVIVAEALKGVAEGRYTFRQFGLLKPRDMGNGYANVALTLPGWPRYREGEEVVLFLYKPAALTGLRTTVGLMQGAFVIRGNLVANAVDNLGLFHGVQLEGKDASAAERAMATSARGPVHVQTFLSFIRKAVRHQWFK